MAKPTGLSRGYRGAAMIAPMPVLSERLSLRGGVAMVWLCALAGLSTLAAAAEPITLVIKNQHFAPTEVTVPAGQRFRIEVQNQDAAPAEFESSDLHLEKIVVPGGRISVMAGPLKPGSYKFFDDYHPDATGTITAVEKTEK